MSVQANGIGTGSIIPTRPSTETIDIAGFIASRDPWAAPGFRSPRDRGEIDRASLAKLHQCGFDVETLDDAFERYKIAPLRCPSDIAALMGHKQNSPDRRTRRRPFNDDLITTLALPYPDPTRKGHLLPHTRMIRVRYPTPRRPPNGGGEGDGRRYEQPRDPDKKRSHSEPYFLITESQWNLVMDNQVHLIITEGELKSASIGLAGHPAIGFGGVDMWRAPEKAGRGRLHFSLDPSGPRKGRTIPIDREIYLLPDLDYVGNERVRRAVRDLAKALYVAGVPYVRIIHLPAPTGNDRWKDVDEFLFAKLGPRWSGNAERMTHAHDLLLGLMKNAEVMRPTDRYPATDPTRGADRILQSLERDATFTAVAISADGGDLGWLSYDGDRYVLEPMAMTTGSSGKFGSPSAKWRSTAQEDWEVGVDLLSAEGDLDEDEKPRGMPNDYPNKVYALIDPKLPRIKNDSLIRPFPGVDAGDQCIRIAGSIINLTKCIQTGVDWEKRDTWLLPPDHRWFGTGRLNVCLAGLTGPPACPQFLGMIDHAFAGDQESIGCLQKFMGKIVCCPRFVGLQQFLAMYGPGGTGKGTLCRLLTRLLGPDSVASLRPEGKTQFECGGLPGKKLVLFEEADNPFSDQMAGVVKQITGQDKVACERKGRDTKHLQVDAEVVVVSNQPPRMHMEPSAYRRRVVFLKFVNPIPNRDHRVEEAIQANELPGILLWCLRGATRLAAGESIETPTAAREDLEDETRTTSPEDWFVREELQTTDERASDGELVRLTGQQILDRFRTWLHDNRLPTRDGGNRKLLRTVRDVHKVGSELKRVSSRPASPVRAYFGLKFTNHKHERFV